MSAKLYHFIHSRSLRVAWAIKELDIDVEIETRALDREYLQSDEYKALNPMGKTPVLIDDGATLIESTAIIEYLANKYANGRLTRKPSDYDYAKYLQWLHFGEAGMGGYVNLLIGHTALLPEDQRDPKIAAWASKETRKCLEFIGLGIAREDSILEEFSLADISIIYMLFLIKITGNGKLLPDHVNAYFKSVTKRESWKAACALTP